MTYFYLLNSPKIVKLELWGPTHLFNLKRGIFVEKILFHEEVTKLIEKESIGMLMFHYGNGKSCSKLDTYYMGEDKKKKKISVFEKKKISITYVVL